MIFKFLSRITRVLQLSLIILSLAPVSPAKAATMTVTGPQDFYFTFEEPTLIEFRTYAQQYGIDSMLWFYDDQGNLLAQNDDWFGLDSYLRYEVQPGITYRLRTGVCCGNPEAWYGQSYTVESNQELIVTPEPTTTTTSTTTTTTTEPEQTTTTTIVEETTTTVEETTTTTVEETTTTVEETTTTTEPETTTTTQPEETWPPTTESTPPTTTPSTTAPKPTVPVTTDPPTTPPSTPTSPPSSTPSTEAPPTTPSTSPEPVVTPPATVTDGDVPASSVDVPDAGTEPPPVEEPVVEEPAPEEITTPEALEQLVESIVLEDATDSELVNILSSPAFNEIDSDKANEIIDNIEFDELTDEETAQVVQALNGASNEVKQHFENQVNVYSGQFDSYVPAGSAVTVAQRRVLVAVAAATSIAVPTASSSRRRS